VSDYDPVDDWLSTDVELMPPRTGAFEHIHRRARRRKATVALSTAAAVAVVIAGAATLPQLASNLFPGPSSPDRIEKSTSPRPSKTSPGHHHRSAAPRHRGPVSLSPPGANSSITNSTYSAAAGFEPTSVTFVGQSIGAVLGQTSKSCASGACTVIAGTGDYGTSWSWADAPLAGPPDGGSGISQVRFLNTQDGWAYGPQLYSTSDGGATWSEVTGLPGRVIDLATVGSRAFAVVATCAGAGTDYAADCISFALYSSTAGSDGWKPVPGAAGNAAELPGGLQFTSDYGYLIAGPVIYAGSPSGGAWHADKIRSGTVPTCLNGQGQPATPGESGIIAPGLSTDLYLVCQPVSAGQAAGRPVLYQSANGGQTWQRDGTAAVTGIATSVAVVPAGGQSGGEVILATTSGIYDCANGRTWQPASLGGRAPAGGFSFVGMTTDYKGVAVPTSPAAGELYITTNGGQSWTPTRI
jgi:photosystem II stability/assembly factor-like uncharacterized protein